MPELRKDPVIGRWVIIATERARRPDDFRHASEDSTSEPPCPFCIGREHETPPEVYAVRDDTVPNGPGWKVRIVSSIAPALRVEGNLDRRGVGLYDVMSGIGAHEVVVETPQHVASVAQLDESQIALVLQGYVARIADLARDPRLKYVLIFKNHGYAAGGGRVQHARSQLIATPVTPKRVKEELLGARRYFEYKERCIFCDIMKQELAEGDRIVLDHPDFVVLTPFASRFPFELWLLPKEHSPDFGTISRDKVASLASVLKQTMGRLGVALNDPPYNYILHTAPFRVSRKGGYWKTLDDDYHWHIEIMPRLIRVAGFEWGSGFYINPTPPEEAARYLRSVEAPVTSERAAHA